MDALLQDVRYALRQMRRAPVLATAIVLTIGLGLGAAAAIFTSSEAALVEPLPYAAPDRLVHLWELRAGTDERSPTSYPTLLDWRARTTSFVGLEGYDPSIPVVGTGDEARMLRGAEVTAGFFRLLGVRLSTGRDFVGDEGDAGGARVAIVSARFARAVAAGSALDQTITVNGVPRVIVGVLPGASQFALLQNADVFIPIQLGDQRRTNRFNRTIHVVARLQDHAQLQAAQRDLAGVMATLTGLLIAVALLLVIMGANLALLMLARYMERAPELALRSALGATRARVLRQLLFENLAPSLLGAVLALAIGQIAITALTAAIPEGVLIDMPYLMTTGLDGRVIGMILFVAIALAVGFGLGPAVLITKDRTRAGDVRMTLAHGDRKVRRVLVGSQIALTVVLLVSSGLLVMSFSNLVRRDVGVRDANQIVTARAPLSGRRYEEPVAQRQFYEALLARSAALPGVRGAALIDEVPGG